MRSAAPVNADPNKVVVIDTNAMPWEPTEHPGVFRKLLELVNDPKNGRETALLKFEPGAALPPHALKERVDIYVFEGTFSDGAADYTSESFIRIPAGAIFVPSSKQGCVIYAKWRVPIGEGGERTVIDIENADWLDSPQRGAKMLQLYKSVDGVETQRVEDVPANRKLPPHEHSAGEETFVLEGCLKDEDATYGAGTWFRIPHGVRRAPYTEAQNCRMLIREGDLVW